jgi:hypothetical protein
LASFIDRQDNLSKESRPLTGDDFSDWNFVSRRERFKSRFAFSERLFSFSSDRSIRFPFCTPRGKVFEKRRGYLKVCKPIILEAVRIKLMRDTAIRKTNLYYWCVLLALLNFYDASATKISVSYALANHA